MYKSHERALEALARRGRRRALTAFSGIDFTSNDYLGLASSRELKDAARAAIERGVPIGSGGSRLLRGNHREHEALESEAAAFFGAESALFFGGGFIANLALFSTLPQRGDLVVHDALIHASVHDGMRMGKAERAEARHNDAQAFEDVIADWRAAGGTGTPWIAVESLYSMDGDRAPLDDLAAIASRHDGVLAIDEAHATGVLGPLGRGLGAHLEGRANIIALHTCGKALGAMGALLTGPQVLCDYLVNRSRPFIYATAPSPLVAAVVRAALLICRFDAARRDRLRALVAFAASQLAESCGLQASGSHVQPVIVGSDERATRLAAVMQERGFDIRAVRPPTVPEGTARVRLSLTLNVDQAQVAAMATVLAEEMKRLDT
ncbi:MAG: 8-amino-7-oxononanoate synthase [Hyphomicrobium sp.]|uniref:8-amino-7-oxononanoate synthase n=1 Tax=Hyphomicrobium sp. TaxID=82 RepID=UPI0013243ECB|nr:8-amino-7-oxononanoate synthase [Hyphomicrobium sp.]KAB2944189.1 MAG: 8-amino-7-oxononanoate synthase [Hyphomicrobium sp.]MBZ0211825.1 8-amino-7-oxononanoate synthase [Hyphomicrobium sp.]MCZ7593738.1 8-amino-7-oxononanoate synthase [Hyphomicrobium sp.]